MVRLHTLAAQASSYIPSELMAIAEDRMHQYLQDKELSFHKLHLQRILRYSKHTLFEKEERLHVSSAELARNERDSFEMLDKSKIKLWTVLDENGNEVAITE